jgi:hypothetical protein
MVRLLPAAALVALLVAAPAWAGADASTSPSQTACFDDQPLLLCVTAAMTIALDCTAAPDGAHALCQARFDWTTSGQSGLMLPGQAEHVASATLEWCRPGAFCQSYGVAFPIQSCTFGGPLAPGCTSQGTFNLYPGPIPLNPGDCMPTTLTGFVRANGYLVSPLVTLGQPAVQAQVYDGVNQTFCL